MISICYIKTADIIVLMKLIEKEIIKINSRSEVVEIMPTIESHFRRYFDNVLLCMLKCY